MMNHMYSSPAQIREIFKIIGNWNHDWNSENHYECHKIIMTSMKKNVFVDFINALFHMYNILWIF